MFNFSVNSQVNIISSHDIFVIIIKIHTKLFQSEDFKFHSGWVDYSISPNVRDTIMLFISVGGLHPRSSL